MTTTMTTITGIITFVNSKKLLIQITEETYKTLQTTGLQFHEWKFQNFLKKIDDEFFISVSIKKNIDKICIDHYKRLIDENVEITGIFEPYQFCAPYNTLVLIQGVSFNIKSITLKNN